MAPGPLTVLDRKTRIVRYVSKCAASLMPTFESDKISILKASPFCRPLMGLIKIVIAPYKPYLRYKRKVK